MAARPKIDILPSEQVRQMAAAEVIVKDDTGRSISLRKPGVLFQYRIVEVVGDSAKNAVYMNMVMPLIYVAAIDGELVMMPSTKLQLEALIQRLDEHGLNAVMKGVNENFGASTPEADKEALKK